MSRNETFFVIINPRSGKNRKHLYHEKVLQTLNNAGIDVQVSYTSHPLHASSIAQNALDEGSRQFIVIGGDGTFNEVVQGVCNSNVTLSAVQFVFVPAGTGNDWHRTMFPNGFDLDRISAITESENYTLQDLGVVTYTHNPSYAKNYFINVVGLGFDVYVANKYLTSSKKSGPLSYLQATLKGLVTYRNIPLEITISDATIACNCFMVVAGIGNFFAGGMKVLPGAVHNNGLLEVTVVKDLSKFDLFRALPQIYSGSFVNHPNIEILRSTSLIISSPLETSIEMDGEIRGQLPIKVEIIPKALKVFAPDWS